MCSITYSIQLRAAAAATAVDAAGRHIRVVAARVRLTLAHVADCSVFCCVAVAVVGLACLLCGCVGLGEHAWRR